MAYHDNPHNTPRFMSSESCDSSTSISDTTVSVTPSTTPTPSPYRDSVSPADFQMQKGPYNHRYTADAEPSQYTNNCPGDGGRSQFNNHHHCHDDATPVHFIHHHYRADATPGQYNNHPLHGRYGQQVRLADSQYHYEEQLQQPASFLLKEASDLAFPPSSGAEWVGTDSDMIAIACPVSSAVSPFPQGDHPTPPTSPDSPDSPDCAPITTPVPAPVKDLYSINPIKSVEAFVEFVEGAMEMIDETKHFKMPVEVETRLDRRRTLARVWLTCAGILTEKDEHNAVTPNQRSVKMEAGVEASSRLLNVKSEPQSSDAFVKREAPSPLSGRGGAPPPPPSPTPRTMPPGWRPRQYRTWCPAIREVWHKLSDELQEDVFSVAQSPETTPTTMPQGWAPRHLTSALRTQWYGETQEKRTRVFSEARLDVPEFLTFSQCEEAGKDNVTELERHTSRLIRWIVLWTILPTEKEGATAEDAFVRRKPLKDGKIPRPQNLYFVCQTFIRNIYNEEVGGRNNTKTTLAISDVWKAYLRWNEVGVRFAVSAKVEGDWFKVKYPDYKYTPRKNKKAAAAAALTESGRVSKPVNRDIASPPKKGRKKSPAAGRPTKANASKKGKSQKSPRAAPKQHVNDALVQQLVLPIPSEVYTASTTGMSAPSVVSVPLVAAAGVFTFTGAAGMAGTKPKSPFCASTVMDTNAAAVMLHMAAGPSGALCAPTPTPAPVEPKKKRGRKPKAKLPIVNQAPVPSFLEVTPPRENIDCFALPSPPPPPSRPLPTTTRDLNNNNVVAITKAGFSPDHLCNHYPPSPVPTCSRTPSPPSPSPLSHFVRIFPDGTWWNMVPSAPPSLSTSYASIPSKRQAASPPAADPHRPVKAPRTNADLDVPTDAFGMPGQVSTDDFGMPKQAPTDAVGMPVEAPPVPYGMPKQAPTDVFGMPKQALGSTLGASLMGSSGNAFGAVPLGSPANDVTGMLPLDSPGGPWMGNRDPPGAVGMDDLCLDPALVDRYMEHFANTDILSCIDDLLGDETLPDNLLAGEEV